MYDGNQELNANANALADRMANHPATLALRAAVAESERTGSLKPCDDYVRRLKRGCTIATKAVSADGPLSKRH